jgi:hypothetical protein
MKMCAAYSEQENWFLGEETFTHTFDTPNNAGHPWEIKFSGCCRMRNLLLEQGDSAWEMVAKVDLLEADMSPRIISLPVIHVRKVTTPNANVNSTFNLFTSELDQSITWSLGHPMPGQYVHPNGLVELDTKVAGIPADCTVMNGVAACAVTLMAYAHYSKGLSIPVDLVVIMVPEPYPAFIDFPSRQTARLGFELKADIAAFQNASASSGLYVGFTVGALPEGLHLSTVRGKGISRAKDPAVMSLRWTACQHDLGSHVICMDAVNNHGLAATQECLVIDVEEDEAPTLHITPLGGTAIANGSTTSDLMMGLEYTFHIVAHDSNGLDSLTITPVPASHDDDCSGEECLPPTATLSETQHSVGADGAAHATRTLTFAPKHDHGGYMMTHCFSVSDSCGTACGHDTCPGSIDVVTHCVTFKVKRCEMVVREGHQLQQIAAIYRSDWLQLWSHTRTWASIRKMCSTLGTCTMCSPLTSLQMWPRDLAWTSRRSRRSTPTLMLMPTCFAIPWSPARAYRCALCPTPAPGRLAPFITMPSHPTAPAGLPAPGLLPLPSNTSITAASTHTSVVSHTSCDASQWTRV